MENVADSVSIGQCNHDSMSMLLSNLRILGPQLEEYSKSTLDQGTFIHFLANNFQNKCCFLLAFSYLNCNIADKITNHNSIKTVSIFFLAYVKFRNASQDERLSIITRMNLLELIELRAKNWHVSDGLNTYYKHKVSDVQVSFWFIIIE